jgi:predicted nucleic acid-binding protein
MSSPVILLNSNPGLGHEGETPALVLDTNVVLDWLVFRHSSCAQLAEHVVAHRARWIASRAMRDELAHVLDRGVVDAWEPDRLALWATWDQLVRPMEPTALAGDAIRLRCTDRDDQKFIDLALAHRARWLLTRDRAVLKLGRRARKLGLEVLTPEAWAGVVSGG